MELERWGWQVMLEYLRLCRRSFVLSWPFVRFMKCRIQIKEGIRIFLHLQRGIDPVSKGTLRHIPNSVMYISKTSL